MFQDDWEGEDQFLIRVPKQTADALRKRIQDGDWKGVEMQVGVNDMATLKLGDKQEDTLHGKMCTLPTYIETLKTHNKRDYYKSADVAQMCVFTESEDRAKLLPAHLNSGLSPATKRIRKRRERRNPTDKFEPNQVRDVETAILQTIDNSTGGKVTYETVEVTDDEEEDQHLMQTPMDKDLGHQPSSKRLRVDPDTTSVGMASQALSDVTAGSALRSEIGSADINGMLGSEEEGDGTVEEQGEVEDDFAAELEAGFEDVGSEFEQSDVQVASQGQQESSDNDSDSDERAAEEASRHRKSLEEEIVRVDHALVEAQQNVAAAPNTIIMQRFSDELDNLMVKKQQLEAELMSTRA